MVEIGVRSGQVLRSWLLELRVRKDFEVDGSFLGGVNARRFTCRALFLQSIILELQLNPRDRHLNRTLQELCEDVIENGTAVSTTLVGVSDII